MITVVTTFFNNNEKPLPLYSTISFKFFLPWVRVIYTYVRRIEIPNTVILPLLTCLFSIPVSIELLQILQTTFDGLQISWIFCSTKLLNNGKTKQTG